MSVQVYEGDGVDRMSYSGYLVVSPSTQDPRKTVYLQQLTPYSRLLVHECPHKWVFKRDDATVFSSAEAHQRIEAVRQWENANKGVISHRMRRESV